MTASAGHQIDPLARLGRQLVVAAEHRLLRRRRRRTVATVSAATLALGGVVGVGAIEPDVVGPIAPQARFWAPHGSDRVDLSVSIGGGDQWRLAVYRGQNGILCVTAPTNRARASSGGCGAASVAAEELVSAPLTLTMAAVVQRGADGDDEVIVYGAARSDVERLGWTSADGTPSTAPLDGDTLDVPIRDAAGQETGNLLTVRPFAVLATAPAGASTMTLTVHTRDGDEPYEVRVQPATP